MVYIQLYNSNLTDAIKNNERDLWYDSFNENKHCQQFIDGKDTGISATAYDGFRVDKSYAQRVIDEFGFKRTMWVLANTVRQKEYDGRWSKKVRDWSESIYKNKEIEPHDQRYILNTHTGIVDILANQIKNMYSSLNLYDHTYCDLEDKAFRDKVIILKPSSLNEEYWKPEFQICLATNGFGCDPTASGRAVYLKFLFDDENARFNRSDVLGVMKDEFLPDWAREKLSAIEISKENKGMDMGM